MKNICAVFILLVTVILCFALTACDRNNPEPDTTAATAESTSAVQESAGTVPYTQETVTQTQPFTQEQTTAKKVTTAAATEKGTITTAATTAPATTVATTAVQTTAPVTTAPVTQEQTTEVPTTAVPETTPPVTNQSIPSIDITEGEDSSPELTVIELVNKERIAAGLPALKVSNDLCNAASIRAKEISKEFSHVRPDGTLCFTVSPIMSAENIAKGQRTTQAVVSAWMNSEGHKKNILTKQFTITGVGCYYDSETDTYHWVQIFG